MKPQPVKLPGRGSGWACKIFVNGMHVATVADPRGGASREAAIEAAMRWEWEWQKKLAGKGK